MTTQIKQIEDKILTSLHSNLSQYKTTFKSTLQPLPLKLNDQTLLEFIQFVLQILPPQLLPSFNSLTSTFNNLIHILSFYFNYFVTQIHEAVTSSHSSPNEISQNEMQLKMIPIQLVFKNIYFHVKYLFVANVKEFLEKNEINYFMNEEYVTLLQSVSHSIGSISNLLSSNNYDGITQQMQMISVSDTTFTPKEMEEIQHFGVNALQNSFQNSFQNSSEISFQNSMQNSLQNSFQNSFQSNDNATANEKVGDNKENTTNIS